MSKRGISVLYVGYIMNVIVDLLLTFQGYSEIIVRRVDNINRDDGVASVQTSSAFFTFDDERAAAAVVTSGLPA